MAKFRLLKNRPLTPLEHIRKDVFACATQAEFAELLGVTPLQVSRLERGQRRLMNALLYRIRDEAKRRNLDWDDRFFFEVPQSSPSEQTRSLESA